MDSCFNIDVLLNVYRLADPDTCVAMLLVSKEWQTCQGQVPRSLFPEKLASIIPFVDKQGNFAGKYNIRNIQCDMVKMTKIIKTVGAGTDFNCIFNTSLFKVSSNMKNQTATMTFLILLAHHFDTMTNRGMHFVYLLFIYIQKLEKRQGTTILHDAKLYNTYINQKNMVLKRLQEGTFSPQLVDSLRNITTLGLMGH